MSFLYETNTLTSSVLKTSGYYLSIVSSDWGLKDGKEKSYYGAMPGWNFVKHKTIMNLLTPGRFMPKCDFCVVKPNGAQLQVAMDLLRKQTIRSVIDNSKFMSEIRPLSG
jgi:hypothetical protein